MAYIHFSRVLLPPKHVYYHYSLKKFSQKKKRNIKHCNISLQNVSFFPAHAQAHVLVKQDHPLLAFFKAYLVYLRLEFAIALLST